MKDRPFFVFVLMPFDERFHDVYRIAIADAADEVGVRAERLDDQIYAEGMLDRIYRQIDAADIVIAEMTDRNPNVFYEVGYAHAKDKLCILITKDAEHIPFDLKHRRHIVYGDSLTFLRTELVRHLAWAKSELDTLRRTAIRIEQSASGNLLLDEYRAKAEIVLRIDFYNEADKSSPELHGIYYYTGSDWSFVQDGSACPKSKADIEQYSHRYLLRPPLARLSPKSWAQVRLVGSRILAQKWRGDELRDSYKLAGRSLLRLLTDEAAYDYELEISLTVDDLPF